MPPHPVAAKNEAREKDDLPKFEGNIRTFELFCQEESGEENKGNFILHIYENS
jgi:hypothetical protein